MAKFNQEIPKELSHLKIDDRGYPIPFFVAYLNGKPDFRLLDAKKQKECIDRKLCAICGNKLYKDFCYFISGPIGLKNRISTDPAMHRVCAEFSLLACPHMYLYKAQRRETGLERNAFQDALLNLDKPTELYLIKSNKFKRTTILGQPYIRYTHISEEKYIYINNILTKQNHEK